MAFFAAFFAVFFAAFLAVFFFAAMRKSPGLYVDHRSDPPVDRSAATGRIRFRLVRRASVRRYVKNYSSPVSCDDAQSNHQAVDDLTIVGVSISVQSI